jgi:hypothetical protein
MERRVSIAGISVSVAADDDDRWGPVDALFGHCEPTDQAPMIWVRHTTTPVDVPARPANLVEADVEYWLDDAGVATRTRFGTIGRRIGDVVEVGGPLGPDPTRAFRAATQLALIDALSRHGRYVVHAATVVRDDRATMVFGDSGSGKSTFAFGAQQAGWDLVADDLSVLVRDAARIVVSGFPKPINVPADVLDRPPADARQIPGDERGRWVVPPSAATARGPFAVETVVHVGHAAGALATTSLAPSAGNVRELLAAHPLSVMPHAMRDFFPMAAQLSRVATYRFLHADDSSVRLAAVGQFLDQLDPV